jgi:general secretion pathway protein I
MAFFEPRPSTAGFTLIEVLVALAILSVSLMSIGSLVATNVRGTRKLAEHLPLISIARAVEAGLPNGAKNETGARSGEIAGHSWHIDFLPFSGGDIAMRRSSPWIPQRVVITVMAPSGARFQVETIRLRGRFQR